MYAPLLSNHIYLVQDAVSEKEHLQGCSATQDSLQTSAMPQKLFSLTSRARKTRTMSAIPTQLLLRHDNRSFLLVPTWQ